MVSDLAAQREGEARHFGQAARHDAGARILAQARGPSTMPQAMASTFLAAPASSTPIGSSAAIGAEGAVRQRLHQRLVQRGSLALAITTAVGRPTATSLAKLGPDSTATWRLGQQLGRDLGQQPAGASARCPWRRAAAARRRSRRPRAAVQKARRCWAGWA